MKKVLFMSAIAAMALASCTSDEYVGQLTGSSGKGEISFGVGADRTTRAADLGGAQAAEKLGNQFIVFGEKFSASETGDAGTTVFPNYVVKYTDGTAYTTESNTHNWEYVGDWSAYQASGSQTIKYWDYSAAGGYTFHAFSASQYDLDNGLVDVTKKESATGKYLKGWSIVLKPGASLGDLYIANRQHVGTKEPSPSHEPDYATDGSDANKIGNYVNLTFRAAVAKVRFAMYETVPGYDVKIDKVYCEGGFTGYNSTTNFAIDCDYHDIAPSGTTLDVVYYNNSSDKVNQPKVTVSAADAAHYAVFGPNIHASENLGYTSNTATYEQNDKAYTYVLPNPSNTKDMVLRVDYTLKALDTDEKIEVKHASAVVPFPYAKWENNYAYTYIFKISDNTNGSTGNPDDPSDPKGLYPITFDACVVDAVTDVQETITTVADPSITTYAQGVVVTENDEYVASKPVYVAVQEGTTPANKKATDLTYGNDYSSDQNAQLYRVYNHGTESITEETVANWDRNYMTLVEIPGGATEAPVVVSEVPGANNTTLAMPALKFTPRAAGEVYAFKFTNATGVHWKVIKIQGNPVTPSYAVVGPTAIDTQTGVATINVKEETTNNRVLGAKNLFQIKEGTPGQYGLIANLTVSAEPTVVSGTDYSFQFTSDAIKSGAAATSHVVTFKGNNQDYTIGSLAYVINGGTTSIDHVAGYTTSQTISVTAGGSPLEGAAIIDEGKIVALDQTNSSGQFNVLTTTETPAGVYKVKVAGLTLTVNVTSYAFTEKRVILDYDESMSNTAVLNLNSVATDGTKTAADMQTSGTFADAATNDLTLPTTNSGTTGKYTFGLGASTDAGDHVITYLGAKAVVYVKKYAIVTTPETPVIAQASGSFIATVKANGEKIAPAKSGWEILQSSTDVTSKFNITVNANNVTTFSSYGADTSSTGVTYTANYKVDGKVVAHFTFTVKD